MAYGKAGLTVVSVALAAALATGCAKKTEEAAYEMAPAADAAAAPAMELPPGVAPPTPADMERYKALAQNPVKRAADERFSTFAVDVDTAAYANIRRFLNQGRTPPSDAVRVEEMINYFRYDLPKPQSGAQPFSVTSDAAVTPWNSNTRLLRVALRGYDVDRAQRPAANLVFLVDVSGSMSDDDKLPLVKQTLSLLARQLRADDKVSIVVYAGAAGVVLEPTADREKIEAALKRLEAGGSTAGGQGIELAYAVARANRIKDGINRVILATDGDFNVGISDPEKLKEVVERNRDDGITLTALGFGQGNYSDWMMEAIADAGNGNYAYIDGMNEARKVLQDELSSTLFTIAKDVKVQVEFNPAVVAEYRLIGYENRVLATEDFANDKVDAGDIGAGHQVTALYEVALVGSKGTLLPQGRYAAAPAAAGKADELGFVELRYKLPNETTSKLIRQPLAASLATNAKPAQGDFAFAAAVAAFGQKLRGGKYLGQFSYADVARLAGEPRDFSRQEFVKLVEAAEASH
ncbi:VWA domain-containing protein [Caulobacter sp. 17J65-9]|uniref:vWA domain-containing protein n=1 Tax=Caulobacter sp. 17J65-9 TaxID=2709382 RepID=UPI0013CB4B5F|nr:VWA domain-containing protein [Caulobacter sp. 17J65-9]NEX94490.1 VWA domain-containing protein [Caulobacter sp. 17J65-9]